jgi:hypothetical protein
MIATVSALFGTVSGRAHAATVQVAPSSSTDGLLEIAAAVPGAPEPPAIITVAGTQNAPLPPLACPAGTFGDSTHTLCTQFTFDPKQALIGDTVVWNFSDTNPTAPPSPWQPPPTDGGISDEFQVRVQITGGPSGSPLIGLTTAPAARGLTTSVSLVVPANTISGVYKYQVQYLNAADAGSAVVRTVDPNVILPDYGQVSVTGAAVPAGGCPAGTVADSTNTLCITFNPDPILTRPGYTVSWELFDVAGSTPWGGAAETQVQVVATIPGQPSLMSGFTQKSATTIAAISIPRSTPRGTFKYQLQFANSTGSVVRTVDPKLDIVPAMPLGGMLALLLVLALAGYYQMRRASARRLSAEI